MDIPELAMQTGQTEWKEKELKISTDKSCLTNRVNLSGKNKYWNKSIY